MSDSTDEGMFDEVKNFDKDFHDFHLKHLRCDVKLEIKEFVIGFWHLYFWIKTLTPIFWIKMCVLLNNSHFVFKIAERIAHVAINIFLFSQNKIIWIPSSNLLRMGFPFCSLEYYMLWQKKKNWKKTSSRFIVYKYMKCI